MKKQFLSNNCICKIKDYINGLGMSRTTASKQFHEDKQYLGVKRLTMAHFYRLYLSFPPGFKPEFVTNNA